MSKDALYHEEALLPLIAQGDEAAFAALYHHYRDRIYSIALKISHSAIIAEEIVEEVFLKIWLKRADLAGIQHFSAYLFTIARNDVYRVLKRIARNHKMSLLAEEQPLAQNTTEDYIMGKEYSLLLQQAVDRLPRQQKQVYRLIKEQYLKREEVAEMLQLQPETIKFHLAQAMKNIRAYCTIHLEMSTGLILFLSYLI